MLWLSHSKFQLWILPAMKSTLTYVISILWVILFTLPANSSLFWQTIRWCSELNTCCCLANWIRHHRQCDNSNSWAGATEESHFQTISILNFIDFTYFRATLLRNLRISSWSHRKQISLHFSFLLHSILYSLCFFIFLLHFSISLKEEF